jgi:hypothetical protein
MRLITPCPGILSMRLCTRSRKSHPWQWVDCSGLFYFEGSSECLCKSHPRQWVDGLDPLYFDLTTQMLAQGDFAAPFRNDLNNPPTSETMSKIRNLKNQGIKKSFDAREKFVIGQLWTKYFLRKCLLQFLTQSLPLVGFMSRLSY